MSGIRDLLGGGWSDGPAVYTADGGLVGYKIQTNHPLAGKWICVQSQQINTFQKSGGTTVLDTNPVWPVSDPAPMADNSVQNSAVIWAEVSSSGVAVASGAGYLRAQPTKMQPTAGPFGGTILHVSGNLFNLAYLDGEGKGAKLPTPIVWDGYNAMAIMLMGNVNDNAANIETSLYVRSNHDVSVIEQWFDAFR